MPLHLLTNFEIQKYYQNKPKVNVLYSRDNLHKVKDGAYVVNLDKYESVGTHWMALRVNGDKVTYFDSFGVEYIPKEIKKFIDNNNIITNMYRQVYMCIQAYSSIMCGYFCIGLLDFIWAF